MCGKPGKGRHGTSHHAKAIYQKFGQIYNCHHFFSLCLEIMTWFLVYECIMMSYRSNLHFVPVQWSLAKLFSNHSEKKVMTTKYLAKFHSPTAVSWPKIIQPEWISNLICNLWLYTLMLQINFEIRSGWIIFGQLTAVGLCNLAKYLVVTTISLWFEILTWFLVWECIIISYRSNLKFIPVKWFLVNLQPLGYVSK
jgi:hypothetical protein